jgi:hypothetical protein
MKGLSKSHDKALCCLRRIGESIPVVFTQKDRVESDKAKFGTDFINDLPQTKLPHFGTCAVVSSASSLKKYKFGREIDAHDAVFRFNKAPTAGFEDMVGSKTTIRLINSQVQKIFVGESHADSENVTIFVRDSVGEALFSQPNAGSIWNKVYRVLTYYSKLRRMGYQGYLNHPVFASFAGWKFLESLGLKSHVAASSGFQGTLLAVILCDHVTSYEVATDDTAKTSTYYFQRDGPISDRYVPKYHPMKNERIALSILGKQRPGLWVFDIDVANVTCK